MPFNYDNRAAECGVNKENLIPSSGSYRHLTILSSTQTLIEWKRHENEKDPSRRQGKQSIVRPWPEDHRRLVDRWQHKQEEEEP